MYTDIRLYALNTTALAISFTNIDNVLKILLLVVSICYTAHKWWLLMQKDKSNDIEK